MDRKRTVLLLLSVLLITCSVQDQSDLTRENEIWSAIRKSKYEMAKELVKNYYKKDVQRSRDWLWKIDIFENDHYRLNNVSVTKIQNNVTDDFIFCTGEIRNTGKMPIIVCRLVIQYLDKNDEAYDTIPFSIESIPASDAKTFEIMNSNDKHFVTTRVEIKGIALDRSSSRPPSEGGSTESETGEAISRNSH